MRGRHAPVQRSSSSQFSSFTLTIPPEKQRQDDGQLPRQPEEEGSFSTTHPSLPSPSFQHFLSSKHQALCLTQGIQGLMRHVPVPGSQQPGADRQASRAPQGSVARTVLRGHVGAGAERISVPDGVAGKARRRGFVPAPSFQSLETAYCMPGIQATTC